METEEQKLKQTREKVSKELQRRRAQVEQEKSKLDEISAKVSKCKNFQELHEKHETELKSQLVEISRELEWDPISDFSSRAIEEAKEAIEDTEKEYVNNKIETEAKGKAALENQQDLIR